MPSFTLDNSGQIVPLPPPIKIPEIKAPEPMQPPVAELPEETPEETPEEIEEELPTQQKKHKMADLFETPQPEDNDIYADDLLELTDRQVYGGDPNMSDLFDVSKEDIMGLSQEQRQAKKQRRLFKRTTKRYQPPQTGMIQPRY